MAPVIDPHAGLPPEALAVLRQRAERLAKSAAAEPTGGDDVRGEPWVVFTVLGHRFAVSLNVVQEVVPIRSLTPVPGAPRHVLGLIRLRSQVIAMVHLPGFLDAQTSGHADCDLAVIVSTAGIELGLVCSTIEGLRHLSPSAISEVPSHLPARQAAVLRGVGDRNLMLLDLTRLLASSGFVVDEGGVEE